MSREETTKQETVTAKASVTVMADKVPEHIVRAEAKRLGGQVERPVINRVPINAWEVIFIRESKEAAQAVMEQFAAFVEEALK